MMIPEDPKHRCVFLCAWLNSKGRSLWRSGGQWSFTSDSSHSESCMPLHHPVLISLVPECLLGIEQLSPNLNRTTRCPPWFPDLWNKSYHDGNIQVGAIITASIKKNSKPESILHFEG